MENKYFTPDIEDLCIGYECEYNFARAYTDEFDFVKIGYKDVTPGKGGYTNELTHMIHLIDDGAAAIRVPYLTKEQIEAEGWEYKHTYKDLIYYDERIFFEKRKSDKKEDIWKLQLEYYKNNLVRIHIDQGHDWKRFLGECKDINTFRKIIKLLNIN